MTSRVTCKPFIKSKLTPVICEDNSGFEKNDLDVLPSFVFPNPALGIST